MEPAKPRGLKANSELDMTPDTPRESTKPEDVMAKQQLKSQIRELLEDVLGKDVFDEETTAKLRKELVDEINAHVDIPIIPEKVEGAIISIALKAAERIIRAKSDDVIDPLLEKIEALMDRFGLDIEDEE